MDRQLVSIGYEQRTLDDLIAELRGHDVTTVFDVRLTPLSRKPGMSKKRISEAAASVGITYVHAKALGNPRDNRDAYHRGEADAFKRYRAILAGPDGAGAVREIAGRLKDESVALLCLEADPSICHRTLVAAAVRKRRRGIVLLEL